MATHDAATRNGLANYVVDQLDGGTIEWQTAGGVEVATFTFGSPAFGDAAGGVATANAVGIDASATGGVVAKEVWKTSAGVAKVTIPVSAVGGGGEIELSNLTVAAGQPCSIGSRTYTAPE